MFSRSNTKEFTNFLVLFDDDLQKVVNRSKILTDGRVRVNDRYTVIWGNTDQADEAKIIVTGEWIDLTRKMNTGITSPPRKRKAQDSSENECSPEQLRLVRPQKKLLVQKPEATVIATGSAYTASPETTPDTSPLPPTPPPSTLHNAETPKSSQPVQLTPTILTPSTPTVKYSVPAMVTKLSQKMDIINRRMLTLEALHQQTHQQQEKNPVNIPANLANYLMHSQ